MIKIEGSAIVYCEGSLSTTYGKTAHGLIRRSKRFQVKTIIDSECAGKDAGEIIDGKPCGIPVAKNLSDAIALCKGDTPKFFVFGMAPDGGKLAKEHRSTVCEALKAGLNIVAGLHEHLSEDPEFAALGKTHGVTIYDIRKSPPRDQLHGFTGDIKNVRGSRIAVLGTDSAIGKRTTAWKIQEAMQAQGVAAEMIGTGQTGWLQGARYGIILDALINDFIPGELENAILQASKEVDPDYYVIEGQGSLLNPAYPSGLEIIAASRPSAIVLQHAPARLEYDGFPGFPIQDLAKQIKLIEMLAGDGTVKAITINHENLSEAETNQWCAKIEEETGLITRDVLRGNAKDLLPALMQR